MNNLLIERDNLRKEIFIKQNEIFELESKIINIEKELAEFDDELILENLKLSNQQKQIVEAKEDNILVVACPGSGKTHTLISRYVHMIINNEIKPEETILITFTKKAGMEMSERLQKMISNKMPYHVGSLHGLAFRVLHGAENKSHTVLDETETRTFIRNMFDDDVIKYRLANIIDKATTRYPIDFDYALKLNGLEKYKAEVKTAYKQYQQKKRKENIVDFNDLMVNFCVFLDSEKSNAFRNNVKYIFFDEYQDVNPIQNYILSKLSFNKKLMIVGDDAQAIYAFRGSSVDYILNFEKNYINTKMYLLEENYRSTPAIVNFCNDIISNNKKQYNKTVISTHDNFGLKPNIYSFLTPDEQYKWVVDDIKNKLDNGISPSNIVILSRKNKLLNRIEMILLEKKISVTKNIGVSLLEKTYIKDFLSFIVIFINPKSSIHWKRIITLLKGFSVIKANKLIDKNENIFETLREMSETNEHIKTLCNFYNYNKKKRDNEKTEAIVSYLEELWRIKGGTNVTKNIIEIRQLLSYLKNVSMENFINDLYLNQEVETNMDNTIFLTTVHGSKGLEWDYVYIIDMDCNNFPSIMSNYYKNEFEEMDEERRLFYVASSRAKKYLTITYSTQNAYPSPFITELNKNNYISCGTNDKALNKSYIISKDVMNYIRVYGMTQIYDEINKINNNRTFGKALSIDNIKLEQNHRIVIGNFYDYLLAKMVQICFPSKIQKFDIYRHNNIPSKIYNEYIDEKSDWRNILNSIYYIASYQSKLNNEDDVFMRNILLSDETIKHYEYIERYLDKMITQLKPKQIFTHYNVNLGDVKGEIDILVDDTIIEIKSSFENNDIATTSYILQTILYSYLLIKKHNEKNVKNIILYNPIKSEVNNMDISNVSVKKIKQLIYNNN